MQEYPHIHKLEDHLQLGRRLANEIYACYMPLTAGDYQCTLELPILSSPEFHLLTRQFLKVQF